MITKEQLAKYEMTIGIECHVQLKTRTKLFASVDNNAVDAAPNTTVSPICFGMPGVLPVLNEEVVHLAMRAGAALNAEVATFSKFDRKHYFYPDLPKGYQITQFDQPTVGQGAIEVPLTDGSSIKVGITRAHIEEDAGKSSHPGGKDYSLVDLNRAGTPLLEIVSDPDMHSAEEARAYAHELYLLMKYADVSFANLSQGNMRFDVNLSIALKGSAELGTRSEVKNLNSFRSVEKAAEYEFKRQVELLEKGQEVIQETRGWDDAKQKTLSQRTKEDAHDYRYFPEPDVPPIQLEQSQIDAAAKELDFLPGDVRVALKELGLNHGSIEFIVEDKAVADVTLQILRSSGDVHAKRIANMFVNVLARYEDDTDRTLSIDPKGDVATKLVELSEMAETGKLNSNAANEVFFVVLQTGEHPSVIAESKNLIQVSDESAIEKIVDGVIAANASAAQDVRDGEMKAIGFLVGQVMKESKGQANPQMATKLLKSKLS